ncbi:hypothetical protein AJE_00720 [Alishewanella jeotgali KCTC 22429]|uniref:Uncharacterized protein n=1 Tax=Alishewanella jeotgali KCTC 22429 TaxID=1129374 RepID=H3Z9Z3_9ALTE|nr:hypothetical protein AJE_00720 [Alishewanella jeotgali KCTC 22429]
MKLQLKKQVLPEFAEMYVACFGVWPKKHKLAAEFFGVSEQTAKRWYETNNPSLVAHRYLTVHYRGYLPLTGAWQFCRIDKDGILHTPHGVCSPGDITMLWRYKWSAEQNARQYQKAKQKLKDLQSGTQLKMLRHTADYLNRLVLELTQE